jgi:serine/threonine-protein kinase
MQAHEPPPSTTLVAGKYQLLGLIGRGGMGSVWEGRHATLGTRVAIKFIEAEYANSQDARSRFDNEARAAATIQSKHAIQIYDHGVTEDGRPYIVMEMLIGEPLEKRLERMGRLQLQETARIIQQVSRALGRAHEKGIIHRDLKPENIFLVQDEDSEIAKVLDFGIAKIKANPGEMGISSSTKTGAVLGTPFYMSPEQARGLRTIDHRTDIWSLGVIAFKCATGKLPFDGESVGDLLVKICTSPVPVPSQVMPGLPPGFDAWFSRVMEREPERRFGSVQEMSEALAYAAGITMRQPISGGQGQQTPMVGGQVAPSPTYRQTSNPNFSGSAPALGGTQSPFTTSAHDAVPMKSNKGVVIVSIVVALVVLGGVIGGGLFIFGKNKTQATPLVPTDTVAMSASTPPPPATDVIPKADTPKPADSTAAVDTTPKKNGAGVGVTTNNVKTNGTSKTTTTTSTTKGPGTTTTTTTTTTQAQTTTTTVKPPAPPPPKGGKVDESGY